MMCKICRLHQKMQTADEMGFWLEYTNDGAPLFVMDSTGRGGGCNAVQVQFCPFCGAPLLALEEESEGTEDEK